MTCKKIIKTSEKDLEIIKSLNKADINTTKVLKKLIETTIQVCMEGYAEISAIRINSSLEFETQVRMTMEKELDILSELDFSILIDFLVEKFLGIESSSETNVSLSLSENKKTSMDSLLEFLSKREEILATLDDEQLSLMDLVSLETLDYSTIGSLETKSLDDLDISIMSLLDSELIEELDFVNPDALTFVGVYMTCKKILNIISSMSFTMTMNMLMYSIGRLNDYDLSILSTLDIETLDSLDRVLIP